MPIQSWVQAAFLCVIMLSFMVLSGCGSGGAHIVSTVQSPVAYAVPESAQVCVPVTDDLPFKDSANEGSGERMAKRLAKAVERSGRTPLILTPGDACETEGGGFLLKAKLLHYENRYVGFSSNVDRISVRVTLYQAPPEIELNGFFITARSNLNSMMWEVVDVKPEGLLEKDFDEVVKALLDGEGVS